MWDKQVFVAVCWLAIAYGCQQNEIDFNNPEQEFSKFITNQGRQYKDENEKATRYALFQKTLQQIQKDQATARGNVQYGIGPFADYTDEEKLNMASRRPPRTSNKPNLNLANILNRKKRQTPPDNFDWRPLNGVTPIKNQGGCGSCWAFSSVAVAESQFMIYKDTQYDLSEQEITDCVNNDYGYYDYGCGGGYAEDGLDYMVWQHVSLESAYPYTGASEGCKNLTQNKVGIGSWYSISPLDENLSLQVVYNHGPVVHNIICPSSLYNYQSGIYWPTEADCQQGIESSCYHSIAIIGYGVSNGIDYWIMKNSWGTNWGSYGGYFLMARGNLTCATGELMSTASLVQASSTTTTTTTTTTVTTTTELPATNQEPCNTAQVAIDVFDYGLDTNNPCGLQSCPNYRGYGLFTNAESFPVSDLGYMTFWDSADSSNPTNAIISNQYALMFVNSSANPSCSDICVVDEQGNFYVNNDTTQPILLYFIPYCDTDCYVYAYPSTGTLLNLNTSETVSIYSYRV